jgi:hypothetical protein
MLGPRQGRKWMTTKTKPAQLLLANLIHKSGQLVAGPNLLLIDLIGDNCDVTPYTIKYEPVKKSIVNAATAYIYLES